MAHGNAREGKWRGNWQMEWVASTLRTTSEHGVSSITTADAHTSAASGWLKWHPRRFKWTRPFRRKTKSGFCACAITFQMQSTTFSLPQNTQISTEAHITITTHTTFIMSPQELFLKLLDLLRQNVLSYVPVMPVSQHTTNKDSHFYLSATRRSKNFCLIYITVTFSISRPKSSTLTVHMDSHEHLGMSYTL